MTEPAWVPDGVDVTQPGWSYANNVWTYTPGRRLTDERLAEIRSAWEEGNDISVFDVDPLLDEIDQLRAEVAELRASLGHLAARHFDGLAADSA